MEKSSVIFKMKTKLPGRFKCAEGSAVADAVIFDVDEKSGKVSEAKRIRF